MTAENGLAVPSDARQKPRLILMGEFSSGKSTLSNILLGAPTLPTQVTATRLPPVHISHGAPGAFALTRAGDWVEVDLSDAAALSPDEYRSLHVTMESDTLELCDLVDMPGISDPNMPADTWDSLVGSTDHVIWCTHATQAWRQSEAAAWDRMREATSGQNILLVTQFDKLRNRRDRNRVLDRVIAETSGKFSAVFPVSLLDAMAAGDDFDAWQESGAHVFMERLIEILLGSQSASGPVDRLPDADDLILKSQEPAPTVTDDHAPPLTVDFTKSKRRKTERFANDDQGEVGREARVTPRRVQAKAGTGDRARPQRSAESSTFASTVEIGLQ